MWTEERAEGVDVVGGRRGNEDAFDDVGDHAWLDHHAVVVVPDLDESDGGRCILAVEELEKARWR